MGHSLSVTNETNDDIFAMLRHNAIPHPDPSSEKRVPPGETVGFRINTMNTRPPDSAPGRRDFMTADAYYVTIRATHAPSGQNYAHSETLPKWFGRKKLFVQTNEARVVFSKKSQGTG